MPFHSVAIFHRRDGTAPSASDYNVITTPDRATADILYRFIQENPERGGCKFTNLEHASAQMWSFDAESADDFMHKEPILPLPNGKPRRRIATI
ncbi:hypothetical protein BDW62DRAFT_200173 [Aspergillus aurantiobrunneus]